MPGTDILDQRKTNTRTGLHADIIQPLKRLKCFGLTGILNARTTILNFQFSRCHARRHHAIVRGVFNSVIKQVGAQLAQQNTIPHHLMTLFTLITEVKLPGSRRRITAKTGFTHNGGQIDTCHWLIFTMPRFNAGQL